jgi:hypothetical protein
VKPVAATGFVEVLVVLLPVIILLIASCVMVLAKRPVKKKKAAKKRSSGILSGIRRRGLHPAGAAFERAEMWLKGPGDPRLAIISCYRSLQSELAERGISAPATATPREWGAAVMKRMPVKSMLPLTGLFEVAAYSRREMTEKDRKLASSYLRTARGELRAWQ